MGITKTTGTKPKSKPASKIVTKKSTKKSVNEKTPQKKVSPKSSLSKEQKKMRAYLNTIKILGVELVRELGKVGAHLICEWKTDGNYFIMVAKPKSLTVTTSYTDNIFQPHDHVGTSLYTLLYLIQIGDSDCFPPYNFHALERAGTPREVIRCQNDILRIIKKITT